MEKKMFVFLILASFLQAQDVQEGSAPSQEVAVFSPEISQPSIIQPQESLEVLPPALPLPRKNAFLAATLSSLIPGLGHVYLGDMKTAGSVFGVAGASLGLLAYDRMPDGVRVAGYWGFQSAVYYGVYAAYRDARKYNRNEGYSYPMPMDDLSDLAFAPFRFSVLKKPEVWGGALGCLAAGVFVAAISQCSVKMPLARHHDSNLFVPIVAFPVAFSEECLFRGYLQSMTSEKLTPWGGIAFTSLVFGAAHIVNANGLSHAEKRTYYTYSVPLITAIGAYLGWVTHKHHSLKEAVAIHAWYDFSVFALSYLAASALNEPMSSGFALPFSY